MTTTKRLLLTLALTICCLTSLMSQRVYNLTASDVKVDSLLPVVSYSFPLSGRFQDSLYSVSIQYPEFIPMRAADIRRCQHISDRPFPALPQVDHQVVVSRKQGQLEVSLMPLVCRDGRYQKLVSFTLKVDARPRQLLRTSKTLPTTQRYADHSVLATGKWVKIRVPSTALYAMTSDWLRKAGFSDPSKVKVFGYGGALQPERLTADYLAQTDDLHEQPVCQTADRLLFYGVGPVNWDSQHQRVRNPYSDYGYYFLTEGDAPARMAEADFLATTFPTAADHHTLYEVDDYAWYQGGRNLFDATILKAGSHYDYKLAGGASESAGSLTVSLSADAATYATVSINGTPVGSVSIEASSEYDVMQTATATFSNIKVAPSNIITISPAAGTATTRLDYLSLYHEQSKTNPQLSAQYPAPELVGAIEPQDLHADGPADMVIIIPSGLPLQAQAERLKKLHEDHDGLRVRIVDATQLYHEFSSGTPDANAYRRYLKMLYDRAADERDMPRYLVLMGDGAWDNRMRTKAWKGYSPDQFLLTYESENSSSRTACYVTDDYFCMLDDEEGADLVKTDKADVAVGRLPVRTVQQAKDVVDKMVDYVDNKNADNWKNTICVMGDDGNENQHMKDADAVAQLFERNFPAMQVKRIMWDAYPRISTASEHSYPDVSRLIRQQMKSGALIMNYSGHGAATTIAHEKVVSLGDFADASSPRLPLWVTASCDIMPFDGQMENIGETALLNPKGGAIAFFGTTRTVYQTYNRMMNQAFSSYVLKEENGQRISVGEAVRRAKNDLITRADDRTVNKLQYTLLGDPALVLTRPTRALTVDSINGIALSDMEGSIKVGAGATVRVSGRVLNDSGAVDEGFDGLLSGTVLDAEQTITCRLNDPSGADAPFTYQDRTRTIFQGTDSVRQGRYTFSFCIPRDISYADAAAMIRVYAVSNDRTTEGNGYSERLVLGGEDANANDHEGPEVYCYLNTSSFVDGGRTHTTPYFVAELSDPSGINATGNGIGHDLTLVIDGQLTRTYTLNDYFRYDFGSHTQGTVGFSIPELDEGEHQLLFRAWDMQNNATTRELHFQVVRNLEPEYFEVECTENPAKTTTGFRIIHDRVGSPIHVVIEVYDLSGRLLWQHDQQTMAEDNSLTVQWNLTTGVGGKLHTGVYLYRVRLSSEGSSQVSKAKKLVVLDNK